MNSFWELIQSHDIVSLLMLVLVLHLISQAMANPAGRLHFWARRIGGIAFWLYAIKRLREEGFVEPLQICEIGFRGLLAGCIVQGFTLIAVTPVSIVLKKIADAWRGTTFHIGNWRTRQQSDRRCREQQLEDHRRQLEWEAAAPERQRHQCESDQQAQTEANRRAGDKHRREEARLGCMLLRDQYSTELASRFTRERLDDYFETYMTDSHSPEEVEARAAQLRGMIEQALAASGATQKKQFRSVVEIAEYFRTLCEEAEKSNYDSDIVDSIIARYHTQEDRAVAEFFKS